MDGSAPASPAVARGRRIHEELALGEDGGGKDEARRGEDKTRDVAPGAETGRDGHATGLPRRRHPSSDGAIGVCRHGRWRHTSPGGIGMGAAVHAAFARPTRSAAPASKAAFARSTPARRASARSRSISRVSRESSTSTGTWGIQPIPRVSDEATRADGQRRSRPTSVEYRQPWHESLAAWTSKCSADAAIPAPTTRTIAIGPTRRKPIDLFPLLAPAIVAGGERQLEQTGDSVWFVQDQEKARVAIS